jgi:hypothetical protein
LAFGGRLSANSGHRSSISSRIGSEIASMCLKSRSRSRQDSARGQARLRGCWHDDADDLRCLRLRAGSGP